MRVVNVRTEHDSAAPRGQRTVHLAVLECGHTRRVAHRHTPRDMRCDEGCDEHDWRLRQHRKPGDGLDDEV